ncbi:DUF6646 family protein [Cruoricaptor ignavus]|uniref:DUF6646 family protein n=1 Tax=Cruoricaptor ignavus TaxID=1118202 RepID=UPI00370D3DFF
MKKLLLAAAAAFIANFASAQAWGGQNSQTVSGGFNVFGYGSGIAANYEYGFTNTLSAGAGLHLYFNNNEHDGKERQYFIFGRLNAHLQDVLSLPQQWDVYPGVDLGIVGGDLGFGVHIGGRYFFNDKFGAFAEIGSHGALGIVVNL